MGRKSSGPDGTSNLKVREVLQLVQKEGHLSKLQADYCSEACIERYLRARGGNVKKAAKQLRASLAWRENLDFGYLTADDFSAELAAGVAFVAGHDDNGQPVLILRMRHEFLLPRSQKRFMRFLVFSFEVAVASMPPGVEQWVMLIDFAGSSKASSSPLSFIFTILKIISDHYPERLAPSFFVDAPSMFYYLWKGMGPFIDHATREKWSFASLKDHLRIPSPAMQEAECSQISSCSSCTPSFRHGDGGGCYEDRLSALSFLTPLSSPGGQSFFKRSLDHSLGAALASDIQHRSFSFSSPANRTPEACEADCRNLRPDCKSLYGSPVFLRSSRSRRSSSRDVGPVSYMLRSSDRHGHGKHHHKDRNADPFRPYVRMCRASYNETCYRATMKPPLGGLLSVIKNALNLGQN